MLQSLIFYNKVYHIKEVLSMYISSKILKVANTIKHIIYYLLFIDILINNRFSKLLILNFIL